MKPPSNLLKAAVIALAVANAFLGTASLPLDSHEVFVVQTAQEMHDRGSWLVPWFNDKPRLTKPPLSYWLTTSVVKLSPGPFDVQPWQGRVPSALAGIAIVLMTARIGRLLFGAAEGWLAATIVASSAGYLTYTHSARPEMAYAAACTAMMLAFVSAWKSADEPWRRRSWAVAMWIGFALATLAKGPHVPALILLGIVIFVARQRVGWKQGFALLQPVTGVVVGIGIPFAWFVAVNRALEASGGNGLADSQLTGTLYRIDWLAALTPYYAVTYPLLFLPWLVMLPFLRHLPVYRVEARLLLWLLAVTLFLLNFAVQRHGYYALPLLAPGAVLLASSMIRALQSYAEDRAPRWWRWMGGVTVLAVVALLGWIAAGSTGTTLLIIVPFIAEMAVLAGIGRGTPSRVFASIVVSFAIATMTLSATQLAWSDQRSDRVQTALAAKEHVTADTTLIALGVSDELLLYYTKHKVIPCGTREDLLRHLESAPGRTAVVVVDEERRPLLAAPIDVTFVGGFGEEEVVIARLP